MNLFQKYALRTLRKNRVRTLVTVVGIVLSMALFTAVLEGANSGLDFMIRAIEESDGAFYGYFPTLSEADANRLSAEEEIKDMALWEEVGWAKIEGENDYKPYLTLWSMGEDLTDLLAVTLVEGRLPENENEILLPEHLELNGGVRISVGEEITLKIGTRVRDGAPLFETDAFFGEESGETIENAAARTFLVVGRCRRLSGVAEPYSSPGYFALTKGAGDGRFGAFFTVKHVRRFYEFAENQTISNDLRTNDDLLRFRGAIRDDNVRKLLYRFAAILCALIAFGSISLIYNSFAISVSERTREYGVLKSVGATKKQIASSVLFEALLLAGAGIPCGAILGLAGIGITLRSLGGVFSRFLFDGSATEMRLAADPWLLLIAAAVCLLTTLVSAWIPSRRATRVSPMEAIRSSSDVKIRAKEVKTSFLTRKLFGFEGVMAAKNFKRSRKRYRATILSLFLSVVLFISASAFTGYLTSAVVALAGDDAESDVVCYAESEPLRALYPTLSALPGVKRALYSETTNLTVLFDRADAAPDYGIGREEDGAVRRNEAEEHVTLVFLEEEEFRALLKENGVPEEGYFDPASPLGLLYNRATVRLRTEGGRKVIAYSLVNEARLPVTLRSVTVVPPEGTVDFGTEIGENGDTLYCFYPAEDYERAANGETEFDDAKIIRLTVDEAGITKSFRAGGVIRETLFSSSPNQPLLIYPLSAQKTVLASPDGEEQEEAGLPARVDFLTEDHRKAAGEIGRAMESANVPANVQDIAENRDLMLLLILVVKVFSYGFIVLISLIAVANVFNSISTGILLRRREFAMLRSIGLSPKGFRKMMRYECVLYGLKSLLWGLPAAFLATVLIWKATSSAFVVAFSIPWGSILIAVGSVFLVVFATMLYAAAKIRKDNLIDVIKNEAI